VAMEGWQARTAPGFGWPLGERVWVNPSPNAANLSMARCYPGTVMLEGTTLSEGRGTTRPLELFGAPDLDSDQLVKKMAALEGEWLRGCRLRPCWFEPTFHKHAGKLCAGLQIHVEDGAYDHEAFRPWRLQALAFKALRQLQPDYKLWRDFPYEYERGRLAIDLISGSELLRDGGAALRKVELKIDTLGGEEALVHGNVDGPQRRLAAERAGDHLVGRLRGWPNQKQSAAESSANCVHQRFPERAVCFLAIGEPRSQFADGFRIHRGDCVAAANLTDLNWDRGRGPRR